MILTPIELLWNTCTLGMFIRENLQKRANLSLCLLDRGMVAANVTKKKGRDDPGLQTKRK